MIDLGWVQASVSNSNIGNPPHEIIKITGQNKHLPQPLIPLMGYRCTLARMQCSTIIHYLQQSTEHLSIVELLNKNDFVPPAYNDTLEWYE